MPRLPWKMSTPASQGPEFEESGKRYNRTVVHTARFCTDSQRRQRCMEYVWYENACAMLDARRKRRPQRRRGVTPSTQSTATHAGRPLYKRHCTLMILLSNRIHGKEKTNTQVRVEPSYVDGAYTMAGYHTPCVSCATQSGHTWRGERAPTPAALLA